MGRARTGQALSVGALFLPVVSPWARTGDRAALIELYESTYGENWEVDAAWFGDDAYLNQTGSLSGTGGNNFWSVIDPATDYANEADPCQEKLTADGKIPDWFGIHCEDPCYESIDGPDCRFGRITSIRLPANGLKGTIPPSLFDNLVNLSIVDFSHNDISGTIPTEVGKLRNIKHVSPDEEACAYEDLIVDGKPFVVPPGGVNISAEQAMAFNGTCATHAVATMGLTQFDVSANKLIGMLPTTFGDLVNLQGIDLSRNADLGAEGYQPPAGGNITDTNNDGLISIEEIKAQTNDTLHAQHYVYHSMIPTEMGMLKKLQVLKMDNSRFMRHMPTEIGSMRSLRYWDVKGTTTPGDPETNLVSGSIPTQFGRLKNVLSFNMENNALSGTIPVDIANMSSLQRFIVPENKLSGSIPPIFDGLANTLEWWDTFNNKLTGDIPSSIGELKNMEYLYIQNEHTDPLRNYFCKERIGASANGRKYNWQMIANDYVSMSMPGACVNPLDVASAFDQLSGDV